MALNAKRERTGSARIGMPARRSSSARKPFARKQPTCGANSVLSSAIASSTVWRSLPPSPSSRTMRSSGAGGSWVIEESLTRKIGRALHPHLPCIRYNCLLNSAPSTRLAYLVSQYPTVSHTFILREIRTLRKLGVDVVVFSVRGPDRSPEAMSSEEREELAQTRAVLLAGVPAIMGAHLRALAGNPGAYFAA